MSEPALADVIDLASRRRLVEEPGTGVEDHLAEAPAPKRLDELTIQEDAFGKFVMFDGVRIPVRNGGPVAGLDPVTDWQIAREVEQQIISGDGIDVRPLSWRHICGATLKVSTNALTGWTTYTVVGEPGGLLWAASTALVGVPTALWAASTLNMAVVLLWAVAYVFWTGFCLRFTEKDPARNKP